MDKRDKIWVKEVFGRDSETIGNGLDIEQFSFTPRRQPDVNRAGRQVKILMQGIFAVHRRFEDGIAALKILRNKWNNVTLEIIGDFNSAAASTNAFSWSAVEKLKCPIAHRPTTASWKYCLRDFI